MTYTKRMALIRVTPELLRERLSLTLDVDIVGARWDFDMHGVCLYLAGARLPEVQEGDPIPEINPDVIKRA